MTFPEEKCTFLQKNAAFGGHIAGNRRKSQEGFRAQESRTLANFHKKFGGVNCTMRAGIIRRAGRGLFRKGVVRFSHENHGNHENHDTKTC